MISNTVHWISLRQVTKLIYLTQSTYVKLNPIYRVLYFPLFSTNAGRKLKCFQQSDRKMHLLLLLQICCYLSHALSIYLYLLFSFCSLILFFLYLSLYFSLSLSLSIFLSLSPSLSLSIKKANTKFNPSYSMIKLWNSLSLDLKRKKSLAIFKKHYAASLSVNYNLPCTLANCNFIQQIFFASKTWFSFICLLSVNDSLLL